MNYYSLIPFVTFLINFFLFIYIFATNRKNKTNRIYLCSVGSVVIWGLSDFFLWHPDFPEEFFMIVIKLQSLIYIWGSFFLYLFIYKVKKGINKKP